MICSQWFQHTENIDQYKMYSRQWRMIVAVTLIFQDHLKDVRLMWFMKTIPFFNPTFRLGQTCSVQSDWHLALQILPLGLPHLPHFEVTLKSRKTVNYVAYYGILLSWRAPSATVRPQYVIWGKNYISQVTIYYRLSIEEKWYVYNRFVGLKNDSANQLWLHFKNWKQNFFLERLYVQHAQLWFAFHFRMCVEY